MDGATDSATDGAPRQETVRWTVRQTVRTGNGRRRKAKVEREEKVSEARNGEKETDFGDSDPRWMRDERKAKAVGRPHELFFVRP